MMRTGFLLTCLYLLMCLSCTEVETLPADVDRYCNEPLPSQDCLEPNQANWASIEEFQATLIGEWKIVASGLADRAVGIECNILEEEYRFSFSEDGVFEFRFPNGETGSTNYSVVINPCLVFPCSYTILYEDSSIGFRPRFPNLCPEGIVWYDDRPSGGSMAVYEKQ